MGSRARRASGRHPNDKQMKGFRSDAAAYIKSLVDHDMAAWQAALEQKAKIGHIFALQEPIRETVQLQNNTINFLIDNIPGMREKLQAAEAAANTPVGSPAEMPDATI